MASSPSPPKPVVGIAAWGSTTDEIRYGLDVLREMAITELDTAQGYPMSEELLGKAGAGDGFVIGTKCSLPFGPTVATKEEVIKAGKESLEKLKVKSVDIYYMHLPERRTSLEDTFAGINELYQQGVFRRLGLSNFTAQEVEEVVRLSKERGWVAPSVYQGIYSAVSRRGEAELFPTLRRHGLCFYAYSPVAGGFLTKTRESVLSQGRLAGDQPSATAAYNRMFNKPAFLDALGVWGAVADAEGTSRAELAYRWLAHHSVLRGDLGDGIIVGAKNPEQFKQTIEWIRKGPLSPEAASKIQGMWESIKDDAEMDLIN